MWKELKSGRSEESQAEGVADVSHVHPHDQGTFGRARYAYDELYGTSKRCARFLRSLHNACAVSSSCFPPLGVL